MNKDLYENIIKIKNDSRNSTDYKYKEIAISDNKLCLVFIEDITSSDRINDYILKSISYLIENKISLTFKNLVKYFKNIVPGNEINQINDFDDLYKYLHNGSTIIIFDNYEIALAVETKAKLDRGINTPTVEQSISGPKDSFNENYKTNLGLIRKRIKTNNLVVDEKIIGKETKTRVNILYMKNIIEPKLLEDIKSSLDKINIDGILDSGDIGELISTSNGSFPVIESTERPDLTTKALLGGKVCIMVENSPNVLLIPTFFIDFFHNPEDNYQKSKNITFIRIIRLIAFVLSILTPALYIAVTTYNHEAIPTSLLINFAAQRANVPFPAIIEAIGMSLVFEILRESDIRMPNQMGSAIGILGAIVLGDAAVTAGIVSPIMVIVIAITAISGLIFSHVIIVNAIRWWRIVFMIFATVLGMPGMILCGFLFIMILASMDSFGKPYLYPFAPFNIKMINDTFVKFNSKKLNKRNPLLTDINYTRKRP